MLLSMDDIRELNKKKEQERLATEATPEPGLLQTGAPEKPVTPFEQLRDNHGTGGAILRMLGTGLSGGLLGDVLTPEIGRASQAEYASDLKLYQDQVKLGQSQKVAGAYEAMLSDDDESNDLEAIRMGAVHQPDIYGPVLRDMMQGQYNPTEETMFAPEYQINPETGNWARYQTGNQGNTIMEDMGPDFTPESRMWSGDAREKAIGEVDDKIQRSDEHIYELRTLGEDLDGIKDEWTAGMQGKLGEEWKELTGAQDKVTAVRTQYRRIRNSLAVQDLPPGVASDKDIEMVLEGFPSDFTNYEQLREYVTAMERAEQKIRAYHRFESNYLSTKKTRTGMANAWKDEQKSVFDSAVGEERTWSFEEE